MVLVTSRMEYQYGWVKWSLTLKQNTDGGVRFLIRFICKIFAMNTCNIWKSVLLHIGRIENYEQTSLYQC